MLKVTSQRLSFGSVATTVCSRTARDCHGESASLAKLFRTSVDRQMARIVAFKVRYG